MVPELRTDRLSLRGWTPEGRAPFAALNADPAVVEYLPGPLDGSASDALVDRIQTGWAALGCGLWAIEVPGEDRFVGFVGLNRAGAGLGSASARTSGQAGTTSTGMPFTIALPEIASTRVPGARRLLLTPACSRATESCTPSRL